MGESRKVKDVIRDTFTNHNIASLDSTDLCGPCAYFLDTGTWKEYAAGHPEMGLKSKHPISWPAYSHCFSGAGHSCPKRDEWRGLLLEPPDPPFLFVYPTSSKKHLIFRSTVSYDRDFFAVQYEEQRLFVPRGELPSIFSVVETGLSIGFSRKEILKGDYDSGKILKSGISSWRSFEADAAIFRRRDATLFSLICATARG